MKKSKKTVGLLSTCINLNMNAKKKNLDKIIQVLFPFIRLVQKLYPPGPSTAFQTILPSILDPVDSK